MVSAIVAAAGRGRRMGGDVPKQHLLLAGRPVLHHSLAVMERCPSVDEILWVGPEVPDPQEARLGQLLESFRKPLRRIAGGASRQASVFRGLKALAPDPAGHWVVVHDGVRPLVTVDQVERCIRGAVERGACVVGTPAFDTLKRVTSEGVIEATLPRTGVWTAQTPQAFRYDWIRRAHEAADADGRRGTDDASLLEAMGLPVVMIPGSRSNLKITAPEDLDLAEAVLQGRGHRTCRPA